MSDEPATPEEFAEAVVGMPFTEVNAVAVKDAYRVELARARTGYTCHEPREFVDHLRDVAKLDCPAFAETLIASLYQRHLRVARPSAADNDV